MPEATVVSVRCPCCGHFLAEASTLASEVKMKCQGCKQWVKVVVKDGTLTAAIELKK